MTEDMSIGGITWHSSEEDGGPDVGISVCLGLNDRLWCGEISRALYEECGGDESFNGDGGWFLVRYDPHPAIIAKFSEPNCAQEFIEQVALWVREAATPTMAKTLGELGSDSGKNA